MKFITSYRSPNYDLRKSKGNIRYIILHYTAMRSLNKTIKLLCDHKSKVSSHYLVSKMGKIYQMVDEKNRAWHAGRGYWRGVKDINSYSIGIELENSGHHINFEAYSEVQTNQLIKLIKYIKKKHDISNFGILGHSDVSYMRKIDPGEKFPWNKLAYKNISYQPKIKKLPDNETVDEFDIKLYYRKLRKIGYGIDIKKFNNKNSRMFTNVTKSFQMHYQQNFVTGYPNKETHSIIDQYLKDFID